jgi:hypothetical protein
MERGAVTLPVNFCEPIALKYDLISPRPRLPGLLPVVDSIPLFDICQIPF